MPANPRQQAAQHSAAIPPRATAKYTNKDGTKFITVPKTSSSIDSPESSPTMAQTSIQTNGQVPSVPANAPPVNRKKQKRRQKQAARLAAEQAGNALLSNASPEEVKKQMLDLEARFRDGSLDEFDSTHYTIPETEEPYLSDERDTYSESYGVNGSPANGYLPPSQNIAKKKKKKKKANGSIHLEFEGSIPSSEPSSQVPAPSSGKSKKKRKGGSKPEKIWNTTSQEERERIKEFWLSLGEEERRSLVKVEKDAVLKKMKEQQKHSCSCTVCGRKRTAIEEELEVLYDAYYEELEQYANNQQGDGPPPMLPPPRRFGQVAGLPPPHRLPPAFSGQQPSRGKIVEELDDEDEDELDDAYSDEDLEEDYLSDEEPDDLPRTHATDFFNFGNSLTVQGGILTVADDLLKNDGKKFIEMMEQLAERRMAREEDARIQQAAHANGYTHLTPASMQPHPHNHAPLDEEEYDEEEEEEEDAYDSQEDEYDDEDMVGSIELKGSTLTFQDTMTEEQRMEEGRRMFQIFAARMFEQRVLTAYKEKVARERQQKLLEELEEESRLDSQRKAKRAKDAQKKKDKLQKKKEALAEEKARKEAEKAAEEAAAREAEAKRLEEQRLRNEEKRKKREAQKKAEEEEKLRKEAEKQRRAQEQRERQAEAERKQREAKELKLKEREAKEAKEKEARDRKDKNDRDKREKEGKQKVEKEAKDHKKRDEHIVQAVPVIPTVPITASKRQPSISSLSTSAAHNSASTFASPLTSTATPALPMAPTPVRPRQASQQESSGSGPQTPLGSHKSQSVSPHTHFQIHGSPGPIGKPLSQPQFLQQLQSESPIHAALKSPPGLPQPSPFGMQPMGVNGGPPGLPMAPGFGPRGVHPDGMFAPAGMAGPFRSLSGANGMPPFPGMNGMPIPPSRGFPSPQVPPGFPQPMASGLSSIGQPPQSHSRNQSLEKGSFEAMIHAISPHSAQPIARPAPIGRPSSVVHGHQHPEQHSQANNDVDDLSNHLGSSALLDDSDEPIASDVGVRRSSNVPIGMSRPSYVPNPFGMDPGPFGGSQFVSPWSVSGPGSFPPPIPGGGFMPGQWGPISGGPPPRVHTGPRSAAALRMMLCRACRSLEGTTRDNFFDIDDIRRQLEILDPLREDMISEKEIFEICETEGNAHNGGGYFTVQVTNGREQIRYDPDNNSSRSMSVGAPGEIGSPIVGSGAFPSRFHGPPGIPTPGGY